MDILRVIIAGGRTFENYELLKQELDSFRQEHEILEIISGGAIGADSLGEQYAKECGIPLKRFPALWNKYGKSAGFIRNEEMAKYGNFLIAFWDGRSVGTKHMIKKMRDLGKHGKVIYY